MEKEFDEFSIEEWKKHSDSRKMDANNIKEVIKIIEKYDENSLKTFINEYPFVIKYLPESKQLLVLNSDNFKYLSENLQYKIILKNKKVLSYASDKVQIKYGEKHPSIIYTLNEEIQKKIVEDNPFYLSFTKKEIQIELASKNSKLISKCSKVIQCMFIKENPNYYKKCSNEVKKKLSPLKNLNPNTISIDTLNSYLSIHSDNLSINELEKYYELVSNTSRSDKSEILDQINYIVTNINKKRFN